MLANAARLSLLDRQKLVKAAKKGGVLLDASDIFERGFFASELRRDDYSRKELL